MMNYSHGLINTISEILLSIQTLKVLCKPHGNHKAKTYRAYTKDEKKGISKCPLQKITKEKSQRKGKKLRNYQQPENNIMGRINPNLKQR